MVLKSAPDPVGSPPPGYANYFLVNQGDGTFVDDGWNRLGYVSTISGGTIATVADFDNDGDLDVVYANDDGFYLLENAAPGTQGIGYFQARALGGASASGQPIDIATCDYDLDGYQDILVSFDNPFLLGNRDSGGQRMLIDETAAAGLTGNAS